MNSLLKIAIRNVFLHWRHSLAAIISLGAGLISLVMFQGYMLDVAKIYQDTFRNRMMFGDVLIEHTRLTTPEGRAEPWNYGVHPEQQEKIVQFLSLHQKDIVGINRFLRMDGTITNGKTTTIFIGTGVDVAEAEKIRGTDWSWNTMYGTPLSPDQPQTAVLGQSLGKTLGCNPEKKEKIMDAIAGYKRENRAFHCTSPDVQLTITTPTGQLNAMDLQVVGLVDALYKDVDNKYIVTSMESAQRLMNTKDVSYFSVLMKDKGRMVDQLISDFTEMAKADQFPFHMVRWQNHIIGDMYVRTMDLLTVFRNFVVIIIVAIAGLSTFNTMMKLVKERTREIGTLRSLGFTPRKILFLFVSEAVVLSFLGCSIGTFLALLFTGLVNWIGLTYKAGVLVEPVVFRIIADFNLYVASFAFLSVLAALTTWMACRSTLKQKTAENLTYV